ncbi:Cof subfamily protein (haloacid dehalogenase superfamily) [Microbacteriaceae bacterium SG_E_30_P1]|uniref:Cof subfamily protein (Haloacid dehalogenase superfamily) n=1 Tax=Antiquaquibacter oligotrophicus TaxID=2880260 RepID=A0ABT6KJQ7_9MICO|nr:Cof-type HAD-IIB family hydrolase [Antiquaquibacter oligotrophicus]MDH6180034.1 Cof subfamily protein (haloacid dehalogenase superfamily) [Antiquaquibacter oligotrophicus]UDF14212.1 Cof-type HAD-IIB family hydrolase [Antiquaquibacter oligotrophicus]
MAVFCSDIDGTLLNAQRTISARTIEAITAVREAGHTFVLCSSRMPASLRALESLYGATDAPIVAYNGGLVLSAQGRVVSNTPIPASAAQQIYDLCASLGVHGSFYSGDDWYVWARDRWAEREMSNTGVSPRDELAEYYVGGGVMASAPPHKIMCMGEVSLIDAVERLVVSLPDAVGYRSKETYLEIGSIACDKGTGIRDLEADLGVAVGDCYFFGDNYNDLPAFAAVGTAIAVANAKDAVLQAADVITATHHDDGVAQYLEGWLREHSR